MVKITDWVAVACMAAALAAVTSDRAAADDLPLGGNYTQNVQCKGDGTDPVEARVTVCPKQIVSNIGTCAILDTKAQEKKPNTKSYVVHVECKFPAGPLEGEITFTPRPDQTIGFVDRDKTVNAVLHPCPENAKFYPCPD